MSWHLVTLLNEKPSLVDMSKVLYISPATNGTTLYFQISIPDADGKHKLKTITVKEPIEAFQKSLTGRKIF